MKNVLLVVAGAMVFTASAKAAGLQDVQVDGFVDIVWTLSDGTDIGINGDEGQFSTTGELDFKTKLSDQASLRLDADLNSTGGGDSGRLEQAFVSWNIDNNLALKAGIFNNNLSWEKEDAPDLYQITHGQLYNIWNTQTDLDGNNLAGLELSYNAGNFTAFVGYLNDLGGIQEENSVKFAAEIRASQDLEVVVGLITQDAGVENIIDVNATFKVNNQLMLGGELLFPDELIESGLMIMANFQMNPKFSATVRYDRVSYDVDADDTSSVTLAGLYTLANNLFANAEIRMNDDDNIPTAAQASGFLIGEGDGNTVHLELIATF
ncbi:MAG: porin [Gammaproteobacteria bacterium]|nr:porin [Gammaproteobacteria bacterium]